MIAIGSDHGGYDLKMKIIAHLQERGLEVKDFGCYDKSSCDYPDFGQAAARAVADGTCEKGIVVCTTGIGISIAANKVKGIRAAVVTNAFCAKATREHNDANILCMGGRVITEKDAVEFTKIFLTTEFEGGRHQRRIDQIAAIEQENQ